MMNKTMTELPTWLSSYLNGLHAHDEIVNYSGLHPEHWDTLFHRLENLSAEDISSRATEITLLLQHSRINHATNQQWHIDPLPFMFSKADWSLLEAGIKQRTKLLNIIQQDLYSKQKLLINGYIPAQKLYQDNNYLREGFSLPAKELKLFFYCA